MGPTFPIRVQGDVRNPLELAVTLLRRSGCLVASVLYLFPMDLPHSSWLTLVPFPGLKQRRDKGCKHSPPGTYLSSLDLLGNSCFEARVWFGLAEK